MESGQSSPREQRRAGNAARERGMRQPIVSRQTSDASMFEGGSVREISADDIDLLGRKVRPNMRKFDSTNTDDTEYSVQSLLSVLDDIDYIVEEGTQVIGEDRDVENATAGVDDDQQDSVREEEGNSRVLLSKGIKEEEEEEEEGSFGKPELEKLPSALTILSKQSSGADLLSPMEEGGETKTSSDLNLADERAQESPIKQRTLSTLSQLLRAKLERYDRDLESISKKLFENDKMDKEILVFFRREILVQLGSKLRSLFMQTELLESQLATLEIPEDCSRKPEFKEMKRTLLDKATKCQKKTQEIGAEIMHILEERTTWESNERPLVKMFVATWNVGNAAPKKEELAKWIPKDGGGNDLLAIGLQECDYDLTSDMREDVYTGKLEKKRTRLQLNELGVAAKANSGVMAENHKTHRLGAYTLYYRLKFENGLKKTITSKVGIHVLTMVLSVLGNDYVLVRESELYQMRLFIFAKKVHVHAIEDVQYASEATGVAGIAANKGAVAVSLRFYGLRLGWISCHLAAHRKLKFVKARNDNLSEIFRLLDKKLSSRGYNLTSELDHLFLLGDLNYRLRPGIFGERVEEGSSSNTLDSKPSISNGVQKIEADEVLEDDEDYDSDVDKGLSEKQGLLSGTDLAAGPQIRTGDVKHCDSAIQEWNEVADLVYQQKFEKLMEADQLKHEMKNRRALTSFQEGEYNFPPTFKVFRGVTECKYVAQRCPSYCDRILWHSVPGLRQYMKQIYFRSCETVTSSDHKPVVAEFVMQLRRNRYLETRFYMKRTNDSKLKQKHHHHHRLSSDMISKGNLNSHLSNITSPTSSPQTPSQVDLKANSWSKIEQVEAGGMMIKITNLRVKDLVSKDYDGQADPYITFASPNLFRPEHSGYNPRKGASQTPVLKHRLAAEWKDEDVPVIHLPPEFSSAKSLKPAHLVICVWDHGPISRDISLGQAILGLQPAADLFDIGVNETGILASNFVSQPKEFWLPILAHGKQHGSVRGSIQVLGPDVDPNGSLQVGSQQSKAVLATSSSKSRSKSHKSCCRIM